MLRKLILIAILVVAVFFFWLYQVNTHKAVFYLTSSRSYEAPLIVMLLISLGAGALLVIIISLIADLRNIIARWHLTRKEAAKRKARELCAEGTRLLAEARYEKAREAFRAALEKDAALPPALLGAADACRRLNDLSQAKAYLDRALGLGPYDQDLLLAVANGYQEMGAVKEAIEVCQKLVGINGDSWPGYKKLSQLYQKAGMWKEASQAQKEVVRLASQNGRFQEEEETLLTIMYQYAQSLLTLGDGEAAVRLLREVIKQKENFLPAHVTLGDALVRQRETEEAARTWERAYRQLGALVFLLRLEDLYLSQEEPTRAIRLYRRLMEEKPGWALPGLLLGRLYLRLEMLDEALEHLTGLAGQSRQESGVEDFPYYHHLLGEIYRRRSLNDQAVEEFAKALGYRRRPDLPFVCQHCDKEFQQWQGLCPECGAANSLFIKYEGPSHV